MEAILILVAVIGGAVIGVISILNNEKKKHSKGKGVAHAKQDHAQTYTKIYFKLWDNFLVKKKFRAMVERLGELGVYTAVELRAKAVKFFLQTTGIAVLVGIIAIFCFQDLIASIIIIGFCYLMQNVLVDKQIDKVHFQLVKELSECLASVREMYTKYGTIPDAINECKKGPLIQSAMEKIYLILTSNDAEDKLEEFKATVPVRLLQTFANVCYILNDAGDQETENGTSAFKQGISLLKNEVDMEVRKLTKQKIAFGSLEWLPVIPMFVVGICEDFFINNIPGTSILYNGLLGYISRLSVALLSVLGYYVISVINSPSAVRTNDRMELIDKLLKVKWFNKLVTALSPKNVRTLKKYDKLFKGALSRKDVKYIYASKLIVSVVSGTLVLIVCTIVMQFARDYIYRNTGALSMTQGTVYTVEQQKVIVEMDEIYMSNETKPSEEDTTNLVYSMLPDIYELDKLEQVERLSTKWDSYHALTWKWWFVLIIFGVMVGAWFTPALMIQLRKYLVKSEAEEDVLQLQTMLSILMYTSLDTLDAIYWMIQTSKIHKDVLLFCYHEYPSNPELSIERMKSKVNIAEFQNMCDKLISTIHYITLREAFGDLVHEREHIMQLRELVQDSSIKKKRTIASPLAMGSLFALCVGHILLPICILGVKEFIGAFQDMGFM